MNFRRVASNPLQPSGYGDRFGDRNEKLNTTCPNSQNQTKSAANIVDARVNHGVLQQRWSCKYAKRTFGRPQTKVTRWSHFGAVEDNDAPARFTLCSCMRASLSVSPPNLIQVWWNNPELQCTTSRAVKQIYTAHWWLNTSELLSDIGSSLNGASRSMNNKINNGK